MSKPWPQLPVEQMGGQIKSILEGLRTEQAWRTDLYCHNLEGYELDRRSGRLGAKYDEAWGTEARDRLQLIPNAVETAVATIYAPQKPKPQFLTLGDTWAHRRKARKLDRLIEGLFHQPQEQFVTMWDFGYDCGTEAALQGIAPVWVHADLTRKRICHDLIPHCYLHADPVEGRLPVTLYMRCPMNMSVALETYPEAAQQIKTAKDFEPYDKRQQNRTREDRVIEVVWAWRRCTDVDTPGKEVLCIGDKVVYARDYMSQLFPFAFLRWEPNRDDMFGHGIGARSRQLAHEASDLDLRIYNKEILASGQTGFYEAGSLDPEQLEGNDPRKWVSVNEGHQMPVMQNTAPFNPGELEFRRQKVQDFWDAIGISQVSAAARREVGVSSGIGQITVNEMKQGRQLPRAKRFELFFVDIAQQDIRCFRDLADDDPGFTYKWPGATLVNQIKWTDVDMDDDLFRIMVAPTSQLPLDPTGRVETLARWIEIGIISPESAKKMQDFDPEEERRDSLAEEEYIEALIDRFLDAEPGSWDASQYEAPRGFIQNKPKAMTKMISAWMRTKTDVMMLSIEERAKAEFALKIVERWIRELDKLMQSEAMAAAQLQQPPQQPEAGAELTTQPGGPAGAQLAPAA